MIMNSWRYDISANNLVKALIYLVRTLHCGILVIYWIMFYVNDGIDISINTALSYTYIVLMILDLLFSAFSVLLRFAFEAQKLADPKGAESYFPETRFKTVSPEYAFRSINKGKGQRKVVGGPSTVITPAPVPQANE